MITYHESDRFAEVHVIGLQGLRGHLPWAHQVGREHRPKITGAHLVKK